MTSETPAPTSAGAEVRRPGVVTFVVILLFIKATQAAVAAVIAFAARGTPEAAALGLTDDNLLTTGIGEIIALALFVWAALWLASGSRAARTFTAVVVGIRMALVAYYTLIHHVGGYLWYGVAALLMGVFILWALYGNERSDDFFAQQA